MCRSSASMLAGRSKRGGILLLLSILTFAISTLSRRYATRGRIGSPARRIGYYNDRWRAGDACRDSGSGGHEVGEQAVGVSNIYLFWVMQEIRTFARMIASKE